MAASVCRMPTEAAEDWITPVTTAPTSTPSSGFSNAVRMLVKASEFSRPETELPMSVMPYIRTAKPTKILPMSRLRGFLHIMMSTTPMNAMIGEKFSGLSSWIQPVPFTPDNDRIHGVSVVPMFEPMMTPIVCPSCMMPELTRPTSMTVMADEDWMAMVMTAPSAMPAKRFFVIVLRERSSEPPASLPSPPDITFMP